jgi:hypothetical protein
LADASAFPGRESSYRTDSLSRFFHAHIQEAAVNDELKKYLVDFYKDERHYGKYVDKVFDRLDDWAVGCLYGMAEMVDHLDALDDNPFDEEDAPTAYKLVEELRDSVIGEAIQYLTCDAYDAYVGLVDSCEDMGDLDE